MTTHAEIAVERRGVTLVAHLGGEIDMTNAGGVRDQLLDSVPNDAFNLVIDLHECRYLDSAGIEILFDLARRLGRRRQQLRLVVPPESPLMRVLELTEVGTAAPIHETLESAAAG
jgi:anti-anti-sigma factor